MRKSLALAAILGVFAVPASAQTILYLNFDHQPDGATGAADRDPYTLGPTEIGNALPPPFDNLNLDFSYKVFGASSPAFGPTPAFPGPAQGGQSLLLNPGAGGNLGLRVISENGIPPRSFTMEAIWWTTDPAGGDMTAGVQSVIGSEPLAGQERAGLFIRTVGAVPGRMDYWTDRGDSNSECVLKNDFVPGNTLIHDVMIFDYNELDPSQSRIRAYRNGVLLTNDNATHNGLTDVPYDATGIPTSLFGSRGTLAGDSEASRIFAIGYNSSDDPPADRRGLIGGIDAVAVTLGALRPEQFVLTTGDPIPFDPPLLVELERFGAHSRGVGHPVRVSWATSSEIDNVGFHVHRVRLADGSVVPAGRVNDALIPGAGTSSTGAQYSIIDRLPLAESERRASVLVDIDANGNPTRHGPVPVHIVPGDPAGEQDWNLY
jgi:hypothetical protein